MNAPRTAQALQLGAYECVTSSIQPNACDRAAVPFALGPRDHWYISRGRGSALASKEVSNVVAPGNLARRHRAGRDHAGRRGGRACCRGGQRGAGRDGCGLSPRSPDWRARRTRNARCSLLPRSTPWPIRSVLVTGRSCCWLPSLACGGLSWPCSARMTLAVAASGRDMYLRRAKTRSTLRRN
jgi:hypothetical protein